VLPAHRNPLRNQPARKVEDVFDSEHDHPAVEVVSFGSGPLNSPDDPHQVQDGFVLDACENGGRIGCKRGSPGRTQGTEADTDSAGEGLASGWSGTGEDRAGPQRKRPKALSKPVPSATRPPLQRGWKIANGRRIGKVLLALLRAGACEHRRGAGTFAGRTMPSPRTDTNSPQGDASPGRRPERPPGGYTILVVDDEEAVRRLASRMITWMGNQALEAPNAREALATIEAHNSPIHLVVTDIKMPGMNGRELGRLIEQRWPGKPILYMSGFASEVFRDGLLEPGAPFLAKPFTQDDLSARVRAMLEAGR
jgi:CheY-like chemotaxis protein